MNMLKNKVFDIPKNINGSFRKILLLCMLLLVNLVLAAECQTETDVTEVPCFITTPPITSAFNCTYFVYNITLVVDGSLVVDGNLTAVGDGTYRVTFQNSTTGTHSVFLCEDSSNWGTFTVGNFAPETIPTPEDWGILFILIVGWVGLLAGIMINESSTQSFLVVISSILLVITGVHMFTNGFFNLTGFIVEWFPLIQILIGVFIFIYWTWKQYEND